jgi:hypothetical protein
MRTDFTACLGPQLANAGPTGRSRGRRVVRGMLALPIVMALFAVGATTALAVETTTTNGYGTTTTNGYGTTNTPPPPTTTTGTTPATKTAPTSTAKGGVSPTKTSSTAKETKATGANEPAKSGTEPTATTAAKTLPFTGLNLTWVVFGGVLLLGMGASILLTQRRRHPGR